MSIVNVSKNKQIGSSLIEVLVALFVLAIGLLGVLSMQVNAVKMSRSSALISQANALAMDMYEAINAAPSDNVDDYEHAKGSDANGITVVALPACATSAAGCSNPSDIINAHKHYWTTSIAEALPSPNAEITKITTTTAGVITAEVLKIKISFTDGYKDSDTTPGTYEANTYEVELDAIL